MVGAVNTSLGKTNSDLLAKDDLVQVLERTPGDEDGKSTNSSKLSGSVLNKPRPVKGSDLRTRSYRTIKFPFSWVYNKVVGYGRLDEMKVLSKHLPLFYVIPREFEPHVLPFVKKHVVVLRDKRKVVALKDITGCKDSKEWFAKQRSSIVERNLISLRLSPRIVKELDEIAEEEFGRYLKEKWDVGMRKAQEEIEFQNSIRQ